MQDLFSTLVLGAQLDDRRATAGTLIFESLGFTSNYPTGGNLRTHFSKKEESLYYTKDGRQVRTWPQTTFNRENYVNTAEKAAAFICSDQSQEVKEAFEKSICQIMGNAVQHSKRDHAIFASIRTDYYASFVVLDYGIGVSETFHEALGTLKQDLSENKKSEIALRWAMMECISSGSELSHNRGRGLPLLKDACSSALIISDGSFNYSHKGSSFFPIQYWEEVKGRRLSGQVNATKLADLSRLGVVVEAYIDLGKIQHAISGHLPNCAAVRAAIAREFGEETAAKLFRE